MSLAPFRQMLGTGKPDSGNDAKAKRTHDKTDTYCTTAMGNGLYDKPFMMEAVFDHAKWRSMMLRYGYGADRLEERPGSKGFIVKYGVVDLNARERQRIIDEYGGDDD